jgi:hypothetical protein
MFSEGMWPMWTQSHMCTQECMLRQGAFLPQALKRISQTLPDVNEIYPTMEAKIATVQTLGAASSQKSLCYMVPYIVSTRETMQWLWENFFFTYISYIWFHHDGVTTNTANTTPLLQEFCGAALFSMSFSHLDLQTSHVPCSFYVEYSKKESVRIPMMPGGTKAHWIDCCQHWPTCSLQHHTEHTKMNGCLSSRRWFTFTARAIKLLCRFPQMSYKN